MDLRADVHLLSWTSEVSERLEGSTVSVVGEGDCCPLLTQPHWGIGWG